MTARPGAKLRLLPGLSPEAEAQWWDDHMDDLDWEHGEIEVVPPQRVRRTAPVMLRLPVDLIAALKRVAEPTGFSYQWLITTWLEERLKAETEGNDTGASRSPARVV